MKIHEVVQITGVTARTLRHYEQIGLLRPVKDPQSNYRNYTDEDLDVLQQILFYKQLNFSLEDIKKLLSDENFNVLESLKMQKELLIKQQRHIQNVIQLIDKTIQSKEENKKMSNQEKFEALKTQWIEENAKQFGKEVEEKYGEQAIFEANEKLKAMTEEQYVATTALEQSMIELLKNNLHETHVEEDILMEIAELHKRWLSFYWKKYSPDAHVGLAQMYSMDERFQQYYDSKAGEGATALLVEAITKYAAK